MNIVPAILEKDFIETEKKLVFLEFIKDRYRLNFNTVQIDICDGDFVENKTWDLDSINGKQAKKILSFKTFFNLEYHLMVRNQLNYFLKLQRLKADRVVIHLDNIFNKEEISNILKIARENYIKILISARIDFLEKNREEVVMFLEKHKEIDLQIMGIENIGAQGQEFDDKCIDIIKFFRKNFTEKNLYIQVDGSINGETIRLIKKAGANGAVVGSYLLKDLYELKFVSNFKQISSI